MSVTILEPHEKDNVKSPVIVLAGYSFANTFNLTCKVGTAAETAKRHTGDGTHKSDPISVGPGIYTVFADGDNSAGGDSQNNVFVDVKAPIDSVVVTEEKPDDAGLKKIKVKGECDPKTNAAYVICRVLEVNLKTGEERRVASGADTTQGNNLAWKVVLSFAVNHATWIQYVARTTSYNLEDQPIGQITKFIRK